MLRKTCDALEHETIVVIVGFVSAVVENAVACLVSSFVVVRCGCGCYCYCSRPCPCRCHRCCCGGCCGGCGCGFGGFRTQSHHVPVCVFSGLHHRSSRIRETAPVQQEGSRVFFMAIFFEATGQEDAKHFPSSHFSTSWVSILQDMI